MNNQNTEEKNKLETLEEVETEVLEEENTEDKKEENKEEVQVETKKDPSLQPQIIGELPEAKQKGIFGVIVFFALFISITYGLPYIRDYLTDEPPIKSPNVLEEEKEETKEVEEEKEEILYYDINENVIFNINTLRFMSFTKVLEDDYYLQFSIKNNDKKDFDYSTLYYIEIYNSEKTLLERVKLTAKENIASDETVLFKLPISENSYNNATLISVVEKTIEDYPEVSLLNSEDDYKTLVCSNKGNNITYYFNEDKLIKIADVYEYTTQDQTLFVEKLKEYTATAALYNNVEGINASIVDTTLSFTLNTQIDLSKAKVSSLKNPYYYEKNTEAKVVKFEMEAMRYTCK